MLPELEPVTLMVPMATVAGIELVFLSVNVSVTVAGTVTDCGAEAVLVSVRPSLVNVHVIWSSTTGVTVNVVPVPDGSTVAELTALTQE
jgi:hypothetical protein